MEFLNFSASRYVRHAARPALGLLAACLCLSCGPQVIEGRPPFIAISSMNLAGETLSTDFRISNQNEVAMDIESIDIAVTVDSVELARADRTLPLSIDANSAEEVQVEQSPLPAARDLLTSLDNRSVKSLPFDLRGSVLTQTDGVLRFEQKGHLYPVPGKPGYFRSAVTQAEELRRTNEL
jgi:hypothetical protein